jgi:hypothetical protein
MYLALTDLSSEIISNVPTARSSFDLFVVSHEIIFFSYPAAVTVIGDMAANLDLCLTLYDF